MVLNSFCFNQFDNQNSLILLPSSKVIKFLSHYISGNPLINVLVLKTEIFSYWYRGTNERTIFNGGFENFEQFLFLLPRVCVVGHCNVLPYSPRHVNKSIPGVTTLQCLVASENSDPIGISFIWLSINFHSKIWLFFNFVLNFFFREQ